MRDIHQFAKWTVVAILAFASTASAQMQRPPEELLSNRALLLAHSNDCEDLIVDLKSQWYDLFYSRAVKDGKLPKLGLPLPSAVARLGKQKNHHWLVAAIQNLTSTSTAAKSIKSSVMPLAESRDESAESDFSDDELVREIAKLFPGEVFVGVDRSKTGMAIVFGLEFDPEHFDWHEEMLGCLKRNQEEAKPVFQIGETPIYHLKKERTYFFQFKKALYGVVDTSDEYCRQFASRVCNNEGNESFKSLTESRYFGRVSSRLGKDRERGDFFVFARIQDLHSRALDNLDPKKLATQQLKAWGKSNLGWSTSMGLSVKFDENDNHVNYRVVYPLTLPNEKSLASLFEELKTLDISEPYHVMENVSEVAFQDHGSLSDFPSVFDSHIRALGSRMDIGLWHSGYEGENSKTTPKSRVRSSRRDMLQGELFKVPMGSQYAHFKFKIFDKDQPSKQINVDGVSAPKSIRYKSVEDIVEFLKPWLDSYEFRSVLVNSMSNKAPPNWNDFKAAKFKLEKEFTQNGVTFYKYSDFCPAFYIVDRSDDFLIIPALSQHQDQSKAIEMLISDSPGTELKLADWYVTNPEDYGAVKLIFARRTFDGNDFTVKPLQKFCQTLYFSEPSSYLNRWYSLYFNSFIPNQGRNFIQPSEDASTLGQLWRGISSEFYSDRGVWGVLSRETSQFGNQPFFQIITMTVGPESEAVELHGLIRKLGD